MVDSLGSFPQVGEGVVVSSCSQGYCKGQARLSYPGERERPIATLDSIYRIKPACLTLSLQITRQSLFGERGREREREGEYLRGWQLFELKWSI